MIDRSRLLALALLTAAGSAACHDTTSPQPVQGPEYSLLYERAVSSTLPESNLFLLASEDAAPVSLFGSASGFAAQPRASSDGRWVAYVAAQTDGTQNAIWIARADGTQRRQVHASANTITRPAPSPNGDRIAFVLYDDSMTSSRLWTVNADGTGARVITEDTHEGPFIYTAPAWSPDGTRLVFAMGAPGALRVATMLASGGAATPLTEPASGSDTDPAISPNGRVVAYAHTTSPSASDIIVLDVVTGGQWRVFTGNARHPSWSPNGAILAISASVPGGMADLYLVPLNGSVPARVTTSDVAERYPNWVLSDP